jgi:hypothetical protein
MALTILLYRRLKFLAQAITVEKSAYHQ